ncbi:eukaryotic translation initiation factor 2-alpha kinase [Zalaria obscura]|uniref:Eukaryotic translation initiation factor 2-alpha kinase n=1 Tax=Zalaria obscura TaxID=2024903 RepID=A0ACC3SH41_9PEZI
MAPKPKIASQDNIKKQNAAPGNASLHPGIAPDGASLNYEEIQQEEVEVLSAIFMEDYEEVKVKSAWSKTTERAFKLRLRSFSDENTAVTLSVRLTATYPKSPPLLQIEGLDRLQARARERIMTVITERPKELAGEVMIHDIAMDIQEALEDAVQSRDRDVMPSLEDERVIQEAAASEMAKAEQGHEAKRAEEAQAEEDRILQQMVDEEVERREAKHRSNRPSRRDTTAESGDALRVSDSIHFDQLITLSTADMAAFSDVIPLFTVAGQSGNEILATQPSISGRRDEGRALLAVRCVDLTVATGDRARKNQLLALEEELEQLKALRQGNIVNLHAFKMEKGDERIRPLGWLAPECVGETAVWNRKSDVWDFGVVFVQMLLGIGIISKYSSPGSMMELLDTSDALDDMLRKIFTKESRDRPSAFDLIPCEFLRNDVPIMEHALKANRRNSSSTTFSGRKSPMLRRTRRTSLSAGDTASRYTNDFMELGRLGKGGFGEVVKARNKVDGGIYAVKKVKQDTRAQLEQVLSEVMLLHRLNHAYVVRYYSAWVEDDITGSVELDEDSITCTGDFTTSSKEESPTDFGFSSRGLDFVSSSGYNHIQFGDDDDDDEDTATDSETDTLEERRAFAMRQKVSTDQAVDDSTDGEPGPPRQSRSGSRRLMRSTLYIQMEYCERQTLRDLIRRGLDAKPREGWQMLRQILEGLAHIHDLGIIHRDLKPDNIFIDAAGNPRIGDFGLATTSHYYAVDKGIMSGATGGGDMTRSVGTTLYVAPELRSGAGSTYTDKIDMYSLGIIFFEMCFPLPTAMERHQVLRQLREKEHTLPPEFQKPEKTQQGAIILALVSHTPSERPSSKELLHGDKLPIQIEDEKIRQTIRSLADSGSPHYQRILSALFSQTPDQRVKDYAWDVKSASKPALTAEELRMRDIARQSLGSIFRRHGAEEVQRPILLPRSSYYTEPHLVQLLDTTGNLLQLPYDLTLPHARQLSRQTPNVEKTFVFGNVYRDLLSGGPPRAIGEVDFDIVSMSATDMVFKEAEVIKVIDEIIDEVPALSATPMCFHVNHSDMLEIILDYCRVDKSQRPAVKEVLSRLNHYQNTWQKIRAELRSPALGIHSTSLDDMAQFDFRETPEKVVARLQGILEGTSGMARMRRPLEHLRELVEALKLFGVRRKIYICPLSSFNEKFFTGGILFQCIHDKKNRDVFAAGGRYDKLIDAHRHRGQLMSAACYAVNASIAWDRLISLMLRHQKNSTTSSFLKKGADESSAAASLTKRRPSKTEHCSCRADPIPANTIAQTIALPDNTRRPSLRSGCVVENRYAVGEAIDWASIIRGRWDEEPRPRNHDE